MKKILRVFNKKTQYTPTDPLVYIANGLLQVPMLALFPEFDEIHISSIFTWDKNFCKRLKEQFEHFTDKPVLLGGPAFETFAEDFMPGVYVKDGIVFTSRGCNNTCPWCIVPKIEGKLKELPIYNGNIIQDNNFMQTSKKHKEKVFEMLRRQKGICFKGGLEADRIDDHFVEAVRGLKIKELWLAADTDNALPAFKRACEKLKKAGFTKRKIKCYALIGKDMKKDEVRLREIYNAGAMPFAMLYRDFGPIKMQYTKDWERFAGQWIRPASIEAHMQRNTSFKNRGKKED